MSEQPLAVREEKQPIALSSRGVELRSFDEMARFCLAVSKSGLAPAGLKTPEAIMIAVQHGLEIGLAPMQALQSIAVINGKPALYGDAGLALVTSHPECEDVQESVGDEQATCTVKRKGRTAVTRTFTKAMAMKAKLWTKSGPWTDYPTRMLQWRARWWAMRDAFPDALKGISGVEEVRDIPEPKPIQRAKLIMPEGATPPPSVRIAEKAEVAPAPEEKASSETVNPDTGEFEWSAEKP